MEAKEFVIYFKDSGQISPDEWTVFNRMQKFNENTTLKEVYEWATKHTKGGMPQLTINEINNK